MHRPNITQTQKQSSINFIISSKSHKEKKTLTTQQKSIEEVAKINLIQLSNNQYFDVQHEHDDQSKFCIFDEGKEKGRESGGICWGKGRKEEGDCGEDKDQVLGRLRKFTQELADIGKERVGVRTDRNYRMSDRSFSITMRNPISTSSYITTGTTKMNPPIKPFSQAQLVSQYIIRQQRNIHRLRKYQNNQNNYQSWNNYNKGNRSYGSHQSNGIADDRNNTINSFIFKQFRKDGKDVKEGKDGRLGVEQHVGSNRRCIGTAGRLNRIHHVQNNMYCEDTSSRQKVIRLLSFIEDKKA